MPSKEEVGRRVKLDDQWFEVTGTTGTKALFTETVGELAARNLNQDVYIPLSTFLRRFTKKEALASQVDQVTVKIEDSAKLVESAAVIRRIMERRHHGNKDFDIADFTGVSIDNLELFACEVGKHLIAGFVFDVHGQL